MATFFGLLAKMTVHFLVKKPSLLWLSFFGLLGDLINSHSYVYYVINCMAVLIFLYTRDYWAVLISWGWSLYPCFCSPSLPFSTVNLWSLATGEQVHSIGFKSEVYDVLCNRRWVLCHLWKSKFCLYYTGTFLSKLWIWSKKLLQNSFLDIKALTTHGSGPRHYNIVVA